jgi:hypothetical protein
VWSNILPCYWLKATREIVFFCCCIVLKNVKLEQEDAMHVLSSCKFMR